MGYVIKKGGRKDLHKCDLPNTIEFTDKTQIMCDVCGWWYKRRWNEYGGFYWSKMRKKELIPESFNKYDTGEENENSTGS